MPTGCATRFISALRTLWVYSLQKCQSAKLVKEVLYVLFPFGYARAPYPLLATLARSGSDLPRLPSRCGCPGRSHPCIRLPHALLGPVCFVPSLLFLPAGLGSSE